MPKQMDDAEVNEAVMAAIGGSEAASVRDMGKVMGLLKGKFSGRMDFSKASSMVKQHLT
jgi:uncharacterized protein YqeY